MLTAISVETAAPVSAALSAIGRTEDVVFSPDGDRLAIAGFRQGRILLIDIDTNASGGPNSIALAGVTAFTAPGLTNPHGIAFVDRETLIVADRDGGIPLFRLPPPGTGRTDLVLHPERVGGEPPLFYTPGSVAVLPRGRGGSDVLICNNYAERVTRFHLDHRPFRVSRDRVLIRNGLDVPDGIDVSPCRRWIAISNHNTGEVLVYANSARLTERTPPSGRLRDAGCPHGLRFTPDGRTLVLADAAAPFVRIYESTDGRWNGERTASSVVQVMDEATFLSGRYNPEEGGPKGLALDPSGKLFVVTSEHQPLSFFDLEEARVCGEREAEPALSFG